MNKPDIHLQQRELARQAECPFRRYEGGLGTCSQVTLALKYPMGVSLDRCDTCWAAGGPVGGKAVLDAYLKEVVVKLKADLEKLPIPLLASVIENFMEPAEAHYTLISQALRLGEELAFRLATKLGGDAWADVKERLDNATDEEKLDAMPPSRRWKDVKGTWVEAEEVEKPTVGDFFKSIFSGTLVDENIYNERFLSCHGKTPDGVEVQAPCPSRQASKVEGEFFCNDCGCGDWKLARLTRKLHFKTLACPRKRPGFSNATVGLTVSARQDRHAGFFDRIVVINLKRRPDRLTAFNEQVPKSWPFKAIQTFEAIDGDQCPPPAQWKQGGGAWGCMQSHRRILEDAIKDGVQSLLVLEDDALFEPNFTENVNLFLDKVPKDWDQLMLGGQHINVYNDPPQPVGGGVVKCVNCQRTHAYAVSRKYMRDLYRAWQGGTVHCDWIMGPLQRGKRVFAPEKMLVAQRAGKSDISGRVNPTNYWNVPAGNTPIFVVQENLTKSEVEGLKDLGFHVGYDVDQKSGIDVGVHKALSGKAPDKVGLRAWADAVSWEATQHEDTFPCLYFPNIQRWKGVIEDLWKGRIRWINKPTGPAKDLLRDEHG